MSSALYRRINELVEEVRSLKSHNERLRTRARLAEDRGTRLANENSSLKHALSGEQALRRLVVNNHPTMHLSGVVAE